MPLLLAACATQVPSEPPRQPATTTTASFRKCYADAKKIWFTGLAVEEGASAATVTKGINEDFTDPQQRRSAAEDAKAMRNGEFRTAEDLSTKWFVQCTAGIPSEQRSETKVRGCFALHRMTFEMSVMRSEGVTKDVVVKRFVGDRRFKQIAETGQVPAYTRNVFEILKLGEEPAFFEAQFLVCLNSQP